MMHINKKIHIFSGEREMSGENGFTLIEVLIAVSIFAIGLLAIAALQISTAHGNRVGDQLTKATMLAQMQVETLKSADFNSVTLKGDAATELIPTVNYVDPNNPINENGVNGGRFTRTWTITNNTPFSRLVTVNVTWDGGGRNVVMSTLTRGGGI